MRDDRLAWEDHELDIEQLDLLAPEPVTVDALLDAVDLADEVTARRTQLTALPGETWEEIFS